MKTALSLLSLVAVALLTQPLAADYDPPTFEQLAVNSTAIDESRVLNAAASMKTYGIDAAWWKANEKPLRAQAQALEKLEK